ncbi:MAG: acyl-CoA thioesterase [Planctomycetales bacterium]|nr:acyl-CoA thioesterase [Planctomycetales bacterium]MBN8625486.1 acyl-CoA thioesterase [Planctomycetota bacterium]
MTAASENSAADNPPPDRYRRRIQFRDTDAAGIAHFSTFFLFMEEAEHEFLRARDLSVLMHDEVGAISWPRVAVKCDYTSPVKFEDVLDVDVSLTRVGEKSVTYAFAFSCESRAVARGEITAVCCRVGENIAPKSISIPEDIRAKLFATPTERGDKLRG